MPKKFNIPLSYRPSNPYTPASDNAYRQTSGLSKEGESQVFEQIGEVARQEKQRASIRKEASNAIRNKGTFQGKKVSDMSFKQQQYVTGLALENDGRIFEGSENPIDDVNPINWIYQAAGNLAKSPLKAEAEGSRAYGDAIGSTLVAGMAGFDPLGSSIKNIPTILNQTYKLNPWAFKPNPNNSYRVIGNEVGINDAMNSGFVRPNPNGSGGGLLSRPSDVAYYERGKIGDYPGNYIAETEVPTFYRGENNPVLGNQIKSRHYGAAPYNTEGARYNLPVEDVNFYKKDWLQGYKKIKEDGGKVDTMSKKFQGKKMPDGGKDKSQEEKKASMIYPYPTLRDRESEFYNTDNALAVSDSAAYVAGYRDKRMPADVIPLRPYGAVSVQSPFQWGYLDMVLDKAGQFIKQHQPPIQKKWGGEINKAEYGWNDPMLNNGLSRGYEQQNQLPQLQPIGMQQMPVQPVTPQPLPVPQENTPMPAAAPRTKPKGKTFTTPGTGDLIAGSIGLANALLPNQMPNDYRQPQYGSYNANAYGTGSTALYDDGGMIPNYKQRFTSKEGGIKVTQEVPTNLGYGNVQPDNIPLATPQFTSGPKHISYDSLNTVGQRQVFSPKFQGFSLGEIRNQWNSIPQQIGGKEVLRGQAWEDLQGGQPHSVAPTKQYQPIFSNNNVSIDTPDTHYSAYHPETAPRWSFEDGGKLEVGQKLTLSPVERLKLEAAGYRFK